MVAPLVMGGTEYLPALEGAAWDGAGAALSEGQKRDILRARVDLIIINRGSDPSAKFDLFQRLNSLGSPLSAQEVRNAMLYSMDGDVADWVIRLSERDSFVRMMNINAAQRVNAYAQEMVLRFLALHDGNTGDLSGSGYLTTFLDNFAIELCEMKPGRRRDLEEIFALTFDYFGRAENDGIFNIVRDGEVVNKLSITTFEILALGVGYWAARGQLPFISPDDLNREYLATGFEITSSGKSAEQRMKHTIPYGRKFVSRNLQSKAQPREAYQQELDVDL